MIPLWQKSPESVEPQKRLEIVVADDAEEIRKLVTIWLEGAGHVVTAAASGRELVQVVKEKAFDLVLTDIVMPDGDGWDAILAINRLRPDTRILAMSGGGKKMPTDACLRVAKGVGADGVLKKPFRRADLMAAVARALAR